MLTLILIVSAILLFAGLKPAAAALGFGAIGLGLLTIALHWAQEEEGPKAVEHVSTETGAADVRRSATELIQRVRQRLLSMHEA